MGKFQVNYDRKVRFSYELESYVSKGEALRCIL